MKVLLNSLVVVGAIVAIGSPAQSAQITFSLVGSNASAKTFNYSDPSGLTLAVTALGQTINQNASGLGVSGNNTSDIDSNEKIQFQFDKKITLLSAIFSAVDSDDRYTLSSGTISSALFPDITGSLLSLKNVGDLEVLFDLELVRGKVLQFSAYGTKSDYRLKSITVDDGKPTAVPTPAMLPGLVGLGLGVLRRRIAA
jgi:hypothetical protein